VPAFYKLASEGLFVCWRFR